MHDRPRPVAFEVPIATARQPRATVVGEPAAPPAPVAAGPDTWGGSAIAWREPDAAFAAAKRENKPIMLVLFTTWCPHCKRFGALLSDARIAAASKSFVMVHVNSDDNQALAQKYAPDGMYIPRTLFLDPDGALVSTIRANTNGRFQYFYEEGDVAPLLAAMERAKREIVR